MGKTIPAKVKAMSVPLYWNAQGLPVGGQFAGRHENGAELYPLTGQLEKARPWCEIIPYAFTGWRGFVWDNWMRL